MFLSKLSSRYSKPLASRFSLFQPQNYLLQKPFSTISKGKTRESGDNYLLEGAALAAIFIVGTQLYDNYRSSIPSVSWKELQKDPTIEKAIQTMDKNGIDMAKYMTKRALVLSNAACSDQALSLFHKAFEIYSQIYGENCKENGHILEELAMIYDVRTKKTRAKKLRMKALDIYTHLGDKEGIIRVNEDINQRTLPEPEFLASGDSFIEARRTALGEKDPGIQILKLKLAIMKAKTGDKRGSLALINEAITEFKTLNPTDLRTSMRFYEHLAVILSSVNENHQAIEAYKRAIQCLNPVTDADEILTLKLEISELYAKDSKDKTALALAEEVVQQAKGLDTEQFLVYRASVKIQKLAEKLDDLQKAVSAGEKRIEIAQAVQHDYWLLDSYKKTCPLMRNVLGPEKEDQCKKEQYKLYLKLLVKLPSI